MKHIQRFATRYIGRRSAGLLIALLGVAPGLAPASVPQPFRTVSSFKPQPLVDAMIHKWGWQLPVQLRIGISGALSLLLRERRGGQRAGTELQPTAP